MSESADTQAASQSGWKPSMQTRPNPSKDTSSGGKSLIGPTVVIRGEVSAEEDLVVMGRIEGFIDHNRSVTVHAQGSVAAEIFAEEVLIEGRVDGNVYGTRRVQIAPAGTLNGNVFAPRVGVLEGASFKGSIDMDADTDAIERRFREKTGSKPAHGSKSASMKDKPNAVTSDDKAADAKGESDAAQAIEKGQSDHAAGDRSGSGS